MVFEIGKYIVVLLALYALFLFRRKKSEVDIVDLHYNRYTKKIRLILRNNGLAPLSVKSSLRLVKTSVPCEWRVSPDETVPYEMQIPMVSGRYDKLKRFYTLIGEKSVVLNANDIMEITYDSFEDISVGDEVDIDLLYGEGALDNSMRKIIAVKHETVRGLSLSYSKKDYSVGRSIGGILVDDSCMAS